MSFLEYPQYKKSFLETVDKVPAHWHVRRLRFAVSINPSKSEIKRLPRSCEVTFLPMEAVGQDGSLDLNQTKPISEVQDGYTYFAEHDVTFAKITPCFENGKGAIMRGLAHGVGFGTTELTVLRPVKNYTASDYLFRVISSEYFSRQGEAAMYGAGGQKRVPDEFVRNFAWAWPPIDEQEAIAAFLDHETAKIDALVEEQKRLIELLKEKRQAVISQAVTKGLDPNVPMKDSGVEWLGEVPAHWAILKLKHIANSFEQGWSPQCDNVPISESNEWGVLKVGCVNGGVFNPSENKRLPDNLTPIKSLTVIAGDILVSRANTRDLVGSSAVVPADAPYLMISDKLFRIRVATSRCLPQWVPWYLGTRNVRHQIEPAATGASSSMLNIGQGVILELPIPIPPLVEQEQILAETASSQRTLTNLEIKAMTMIELLNERRSALISAAVTGKIDVRNWQAPESTITEDQPAPLKVVP